MYTVIADTINAIPIANNNVNKNISKSVDNASKLTWYPEIIIADKTIAYPIIITINELAT